MSQQKSNHDKRFEICVACEHFIAATGSCGTLIIGSTVVHDNKKVKLCGCVMFIKSAIKSAFCPIGKWKKNFKFND
jgi:hypothetical protein